MACAATRQWRRRAERRRRHPGCLTGPWGATCLGAAGPSNAAAGARRGGQPAAGRPPPRVRAAVAEAEERPGRAGKPRP
eukprot:11183015-Lingulodinium_polyedra.AAC.1